MAGVLIIIGLVLSALLPPPERPGQLLGEHFPQNQTLATAATFVLVAGFLLFVPFVAALYWSLRGTHRAYALLGLGPSLLALTLVTIASAASLVTLSNLSDLYGRAQADEPLSPLGPEDAGLIIIAQWTTSALFNGVVLAGALFGGIGFSFFGLAMRGGDRFSMGFAWLSMGLGVLIVLLVFFGLVLGAQVLAVVFALAIGWKVYTLSQAP